jgi:hypothetical protein
MIAKARGGVGGVGGIPARPYRFVSDISYREGGFGSYSSYPQLPPEPHYGTEAAFLYEVYEITPPCLAFVANPHFGQTQIEPSLIPQNPKVRH